MTTGNLTAAVRQRDAAFARIGRARGWAIVGAGALTAAIAAAVSAAVPGRTLGAKRPTAATTARVQTSQLKMPPLATPSQLGLTAPGSAPQPLPAPQSQPPPPQPAASAPASAPAAVSGGS